MRGAELRQEPDADSESAALEGQRTEALAMLRELLAVPGLLTPEWLRIDPYFASLRRDAEFRTMAGLPSGE